MPENYANILALTQQRQPQAWDDPPQQYARTLKRLAGPGSTSNLGTSASTCPSWMLTAGGGTCPPGATAMTEAGIAIVSVSVSSVLDEGITVLRSAFASDPPW
ncbi:hypothetical protein G6011_07115 [Alternaria panax]|uniref:Uncharacterized protein n=1 Tax=Alternaria panax TaxID=48097 RepID=A0AAD4F8K0_9PLEO|nr:hypothetical protein G6011_07115 [Alternaria panax]